MVVNDIRDLRAHIALDKMPTQQNAKGCHISPYRVAWYESERVLYDAAMDAVI